MGKKIYYWGIGIVLLIIILFLVFSHLLSTFLYVLPFFLTFYDFVYKGSGLFIIFDGADTDEEGP